MKLQYFQFPKNNDFLHLPCTDVDDETMASQIFKNVVNDMLKTMYKNKGIGLAAPQCGLGFNLLVMDTSKQGNKPIVMINPTILKTSDNVEDGSEGCLSIPGIYENVSRPAEVTVTYRSLFDLSIPLTTNFSGIDAKCVQHEIDHLKGILFIDHLSSFVRTRALKKYLKMQKNS